MEHRFVVGSWCSCSMSVELMLIRSTLSNLLTYFMSLSSLPDGVANCIDNLQTGFLCGGVRNFSLYWYIGQRFVCVGGLGVLKLVLSSWALLKKLLWCCARLQVNLCLGRVAVDTKYLHKVDRVLNQVFGLSWPLEEYKDNVDGILQLIFF